jgi:serine phosphatase RsbU (regulator of sigma subunit)
MLAEGGKLYGMDRVIQLIRESREQPIQNVLDGIVADLVQAMGPRTPTDDITLVGMDIVG